MNNPISVSSVEQLYTDENHNAFTDLCRFNGQYFLVFRTCPDGHMIFPTSKIVVYKSDDTIT